MGGSEEELVQLTRCRWRWRWKLMCTRMSLLRQLTLNDLTISRVSSLNHSQIFQLLILFYLNYQTIQTTVGSCCLVGVICGGGVLYIANAGDSRAILGRSVKATTTGEVVALQLSAEHNVSIESVRQEMHFLHPDDSRIVVLKHNVWRVKGFIQISRSIGDVYLKKAEFNREPLYTKYRLREAMKRPILSGEPSITEHELLQPQDQFLIFASYGLWEQMSNQEAVDIVHNHPLNGIARRLVKTALRAAAKKREMRYSDLKKIERGVKRHFHDDITVVVIFLDANVVSSSSSKGPSLSIRGGGMTFPKKPKSYH